MGLAGRVFRLVSERIISHLVSSRTAGREDIAGAATTARALAGVGNRGLVGKELTAHAAPAVASPAKAAFPCKPSSDPRIPSVPVTAPYAMHQLVIARHLFCSVRGILLSDAVLGQA